MWVPIQLEVSGKMDAALRPGRGLHQQQLDTEKKQRDRLVVQLAAIIATAPVALI